MHCIPNGRWSEIALHNLRPTSLLNTFSDSEVQTLRLILIFDHANHVKDEQRKIRFSDTIFSVRIIKTSNSLGVFRRVQRCSSGMLSQRSLGSTLASKAFIHRIHRIPTQGPRLELLALYCNQWKESKNNEAVSHSSLPSFIWILCDRSPSSSPWKHNALIIMSVRLSLLFDWFSSVLMKCALYLIDSQLSFRKLHTESQR